MVYKNQKQEEEQACRPEGLVRQEPPRRRDDPHNNDDLIALGENEIAIICGGMATPASKTKLKQVEHQVNSTQPLDKRLKWSEVMIQFDI